MGLLYETVMETSGSKALIVEEFSDTTYGGVIRNLLTKRGMTVEMVDDLLGELVSDREHHFYGRWHTEVNTYPRMIGVALWAKVQSLAYAKMKSNKASDRMLAGFKDFVASDWPTTH